MRSPAGRPHKAINYGVFARAADCLAGAADGRAGQPVALSDPDTAPPQGGVTPYLEVLIGTSATVPSVSACRRTSTLLRSHRNVSASARWPPRQTRGSPRAVSAWTPSAKPRTLLR